MRAAAVVVGITLGWGGAALHAQASNAAPTETRLSVVAASPSAGGAPSAAAKLVVHVATHGASNPAAGVVSVRERAADGSERTLGSAALNAVGTAKLPMGNFAGGDHALEAVYEGDATHAVSVSALATVHAEDNGVPSFTLAAAPTSLNLVAGTFGNSILTLTPVSGFTGYVTVSCSGLPIGATCTFTPSNVFVGTQGGTSTITIQTTGPSGRASLETIPRNLVYAFLLPGIVALAGLGSRRKGALRSVALLVLLGAGVSGLSACGARYRYFHNPPVPTVGTPVGASSITVEATSANGSQVTNQTIALALTVTAKPK